MPETEKEIDLRYKPQIRSLSVSGSGQAALIVEKFRDLKLTTDGGLTWTEVPRQAIGDAFECITMTGNNRGWAVNHQGQMFTTDSAGKSWTQISEPKDSEGDGLNACRQIAFFNETSGWLLEGLSIWHTSDGGVTWQERLSTLTPGVVGQPTGIFPVDKNTLVSIGSAGQVYLTRDGGASWKINTLVPDHAAFVDIWFVDKQRGWLTGYIGGKGFRPLLFETTDGGISWKEILFVEEDIRPWSVCFVSDEGWLAGYRRVKVNEQLVTLEGVLFRTHDGGRTWTPVQVGSGDPFFSRVRFVDKEHGWLAGRDNLYRTQDGGKTWQRVLSLPPVQ